MMSFNDTTKAIDERNDARMNFRTKPHVKDAIQTAAALCGVDDSAFTINAAYAEAQRVIATHEHTVLRASDHDRFFAALDNPDEPTPALRDAFEHHCQSVTSKA